MCGEEEEGGVDKCAGEEGAKDEPALLSGKAGIGNGMVVVVLGVCVSSSGRSRQRRRRRRRVEADDSCSSAAAGEENCEVAYE